MTLDYDEIDRQLADKGWAKVESVYDGALLDVIKGEIETALPVYERIQWENGVGEESRNATHHTILLCPTMLKLIDPNPLHDYLEHYFDSKYILFTMGASMVKPRGDYVYTQNIHRDMRGFSGPYRLNINTLVMLDDSTEDNGATWMLSGSHKHADKPAEEHFYRYAERATGQKGDVLLFDGHIWHAAGINRTDKPRTIITPIYTRPFSKQALDYPKAFGMNFKDRISEQLRQILGYNALVPQSLEEFYKVRDKRFYKPDQG